MSSGTPSPVFAETPSTSAWSMPNVVSSSSFTSSGRACCRSILLSTGTIVSPASIARYALATVCACTPCAASTSRIVPSHARIERLTS
jgi:hypothetical protein